MNTVIEFLGMPETREEMLRLRQEERTRHREFMEQRRRIECPGYEQIYKMRGKAQNGL